MTSPVCSEVTETETERLDWDDVWPVVEPYMSVWSSDGEQKWGAYAWQTLTSAGLANWMTEAERTTCVLRALALAALSRDFYARAFSEGDDGDWREDLATDVIGDRPRIDAFTLGQIAERSGVEADNTEWNQGEVWDVLYTFVKREYRAVARALRSVLGDSRLFASMWAVRDRECVYPLADDYVSYVVNDDLTAEKGIAWEWLTNELPDP
jgi:hypothetical protein